MEPADQQLHLGQHAQPAPEPSFATDDHLASLLLDVESVLRGVLAKIASVRRHLQGRHGQVDPEPDLNRMRRALEYLADRDSWLGDPHHHGAVLFGHDTPYELAQSALAIEA